MELINAVGTGLTTVIGWIGNVLTALLSADGALNPLLPLVAIGVAISAIMLTVKVIKTFAWGV